MKKGKEIRKRHRLLVARARTCTAPDRHAPKMVCGYPMPCPHHTVLVIIGQR